MGEYTIMARIPTNDGRVVSVIEPRRGQEVIVATHNFCDPTTWFYESVRVEDEEAVDSGDGLTWNLTHNNVIRTGWGKFHKEDDYINAEPEGHGYSVVVEVDGVEKAMREPYASTGGDYLVNYVDGSLTFFSDRDWETSPTLSV